MCEDKDPSVIATKLRRFTKWRLVDETDTTIKLAPVSNLNVKVADFGLAKKFEGLHEQPLQGTPYYMSPEVC